MEIIPSMNDIFIRAVGGTDPITVNASDYE